MSLIPRLQFHSQRMDLPMMRFLLQSKLKNKDLERFFGSVICQLFAFQLGAVSEALQRVVSTGLHVGICTMNISRSCGSGCVEGLGCPSTLHQLQWCQKGAVAIASGGAFIGVWTRGPLLLWKRLEFRSPYQCLGLIQQYVYVHMYMYMYMLYMYVYIYILVIS